MRERQPHLSLANHPAMNRPSSGLRPVRSILLRCASISAAASPMPPTGIAPALGGNPDLEILRVRPGGSLRHIASLSTAGENQTVRSRLLPCPIAGVNPLNQPPHHIHRPHEREKADQHGGGQEEAVFEGHGVGLPLPLRCFNLGEDGAGFCDPILHIQNNIAHASFQRFADRLQRLLVEQAAAFE